MLDERLAHRPIDYDQSIDEGWLNQCEISALGQEGELSYFRLRDPASHQAWIAVRAPLEAPSACQRLERDYRLQLDADGAPALHVLGGKLTTYRVLAEEALDLLRPYLPHAGPAADNHYAWACHMLVPSVKNKAVQRLAGKQQARKNRHEGRFGQLAFLPLHGIEELVVGFGHQQAVDQKLHALGLVHRVENFAQDPHFLQLFRRRQ